MLKSTLATLLFGYAISMDILKCPEGTGTGPDNCCVINPTPGSKTMITIPNSIKCAVVDCSHVGKACEKNVQLYTAADLTTIKCGAADTCTASQFVCGRGPPGSDMRDYRNSNGKCVLEATVGSAAKEAEFSVFGEMTGEVTAMSDVSFGTGDLRCFGKSCSLNCAPSACTDTGTDGTYECTGEGCDGFKNGRYEGFVPVIAEPDDQGNCEIKPVRGTLSALVFKNNCNNAKLVCGEASICEKRKIYSAARNTVITCGGLDPTKTDGTMVSGGCKEAQFFFGPRYKDELPHGTDERDFDVKFTEATRTTPSEIIFNSAELNYRGSDAGSKNKIYSTLTHLTINTEGGNAFADAQYTCGTDGSVGGTKCNINCHSNESGMRTCSFCKRYVKNGAIYTESINGVGENACLDGNVANRVSFKQSAVNNGENTSESDSTTTESTNSIVLPVKSLYAFGIIFAVLVFGVIIGCNGFKVRKFNRRGSLIKYNTMELQSVQSRA